MLYLFLITVLFVILFIVGFVLTRIWGIVRSVFSFGTKNKKAENSDTFSSKQSTRKRTKIFSKSEGEYIDWEEVR
jgi:hypothetical protein